MPTNIAFGQLRPLAQMSKKHQTWALKLRRFLCWRSPSQKLRVQQKWHSQLWNRVPLQLPLWSLRIQAIPRMMLARLRWSGKKLRKKRKRKKASDEGFGWYVTGRPWSGVFWSLLRFKPKGLENLPILYPPQQTSHRNVDNMKSLMICKEAKPRKRRLAQAPQLVMLGLWRPAIKS